ncbi:unnamed protein product [Bursaphelenchus xylophilus]|uniref:(pine wood nematode) hypothetical protein n=1 Tax=Bursaphelenchus xylophilus TaxID=6326 RepID=A0A1I7SV17_BURXY|nr:unnamed protein product [Bursaphelenchus xylophilus]CAG9100744.1 unnamed protein product [Bursaphelenchus xylophilus]
MKRQVNEEKPNVEVKVDPWEKVDPSLYAFARFAKVFAKDETENNLLAKIADPNIMSRPYSFRCCTSITISESQDTKQTIFQVKSKFSEGSEFVYKINNVPDLIIALVMVNRMLQNSEDLRTISLDIHAYQNQIEWFTTEVAEKAGRIIKESGLPFKFKLFISQDTSELELIQFGPFIKQLRDLLETVFCGVAYLPLLRGAKLNYLSVYGRENEGKFDLDDLSALESKEISFLLCSLSLNDFYEKKYPPVMRTEALTCKIPLATEKIRFFEKVFGNIAKTFPQLKEISLHCQIDITRKDTAVDRKVELIALNINKNFELTPWKSEINSEILVFFEARHHFENVVRILKKMVPGLKSGTPVCRDSDDDVMETLEMRELDKKVLIIKLYRELRPGAWESSGITDVGASA